MDDREIIIMVICIFALLLITFAYAFVLGMYLWN
jgi:hypothetical protein